MTTQELERCDTADAVLDYARSRKVVGDKADLSRLYMVEPNFTNTGANADNRLRLKPSQVGPFLAAVAKKVFAEGSPTAPVPEGVLALKDVLLSKRTELVVLPLPSPLAHLPYWRCVETWGVGQQQVVHVEEGGCQQLSTSRMH